MLWTEKQKKDAYESAYKQKLDYSFKREDIAGWKQAY